MKYFIILGLLLYSYVSVARVREIVLDDTVMAPIYLRLGKSTILRFPERPEKVVIGNKNYFNLEFVQNDLAIQPLERIVTNLFIYTKRHTYGLILNVTHDQQYDDLIKIIEKANFFQGGTNTPRTNRPHLPKTKTTPLGTNLELKGILHLHLIQFINHINLNTYILDFEVKNLGKDVIQLNDKNIYLSRKGGRLPSQKIILENQSLSPSSSTKGRVFIKINKKEDISLIMEVNGATKRHILPGSLL